MRILVDNSGYELLNLGDVAMLQVAVSRFRAHWSDARITVITTAPDLLAKYCPGAIPLAPQGREMWLRKCDLFGSLHQLIPKASRGLHALEARFRRRLPSLMRVIADERLRTRGCDTRPMTEFLDAVFNADLVAGTGGGYLTDSFAEHAMDILETLHLAQSLGIPTALLSQGLGPVSQPRVWNPMQRVLPRVDLITLREGLASRELALRFGIPPERIHVTGDDALPLATLGSTPGTDIGVNLRTAWYAAFPEQASAALHRAVRTLSQNHQASVIPLPVSAHSGGEDSRALEPLASDATAQQKIDTPRQLIDRIGTCRLVITGSYHAGVFALAQGIPVIGLVGSRYYADKFAGLAHQFHNVGSILISLEQPELEQKLVAAGERLLREGPHIRPTLVGYAQEQARAGERAYELLAQVIEERRLHNGHAPSRASAARVGAGSGL
jgi:polysaccharide pyruvyl transferase WcaK-like protein